MNTTSDRHHIEWEPRRAVTLAGAHRRARHGRVLRIVAWAAAAAIAAWVLSLAIQPEATGPEPDPAPAAEAGVVRMTNPRFAGRDTAGRPFQVLADTAIRRPQESSNLTELEFPSFSDGSPDGSEPGEARVQARRGIYDSDANVLELFADVDMTTENGYALRTSHARVYVNERRVEGDEPVQGEGPFGTVTADRWSFAEDGAVLHFEGNVRTVFRNRDQAAAEAAGQ